MGGFGYSLLRQNAAKFLMDDLYRNPGPLQFDGPGADSKALTMCVEDQDYMGRIKKLQEYLDQVLTILWSQIFNFSRAFYEHCYEDEKAQNHSFCKICNPSLSVDGFKSLGCSNMIVLCCNLTFSCEMTICYGISTVSHFFSI